MCVIKHSLKAARYITAPTGQPAALRAPQEPGREGAPPAARRPRPKLGSSRSGPAGAVPSHLTLAPGRPARFGLPFLPQGRARPTRAPPHLRAPPSCECGAWGPPLPRRRERRPRTEPPPNRRVGRRPPCRSTAGRGRSGRSRRGSKPWVSRRAVLPHGGAIAPRRAALRRARSGCGSPRELRGSGRPGGTAVKAAGRLTGTLRRCYGLSRATLQSEGAGLCS